MHYQKDIEKLDRRNSYSNHAINNWKMANTTTMSKIVIILLFWSNLYHEQGSQDNAHEIRTHNENNMTYDYPSLYMTQTTILTIHCVHVAINLIYQDHSVSYSKNQEYNFSNAVVWEALSNRFSIPTSKEYICKKCDKHLLVEKMPINSVASQIRLTNVSQTTKEMYPL